MSYELPSPTVGYPMSLIGYPQVGLGTHTASQDTTINVYGLGDRLTHHHKVYVYVSVYK